MDFDLSQLDEIPDRQIGRGLSRVGSRGEDAGEQGSGQNSAPEGRDAQREALKARLKKEPAPTRSTLQVRRWVALVLALGWIVGNYALVGLRTDVDRLPASYLAVQVLAPLAVALVAVAFALSAGKYGLGRPRQVLAGLTLAGPLIVLLVGYLWPQPYPTTAAEGTVLHALPCLGVIGVWGTVPLMFVVLAFRRAFPARARWRVALLGLACGAVAGATMNLHCSNVDAVHMLVGHGLPVIAVTSIAGLVLSRWARS